MKKILLVMMLFVVSNSLSAQSANGQVATASKYQGLKIVFQLTSADTVIHQTLMSQLKNYYSVAPDTKFEVVCHGGGLNMLVKKTCVIQDQIKVYADQGVSFVACEFAMKKRNVTKEELVDGAGTVISGVLEIAKKQQEGWSYIKL
jgi:intracellular sulfur oxidation DsrE/DsrF family protein